MSFAGIKARASLLSLLLELSRLLCFFPSFFMSSSSDRSASSQEEEEEEEEAGGSGIAGAALIGRIGEPSSSRMRSGNAVWPEPFIEALAMQVVVAVAADHDSHASQHQHAISSVASVGPTSAYESL